MSIFSLITKPTLLLDEDKARANLLRISNKVKAQNIDFRPHFKTHQSFEIGKWFQEIGIEKITVSSIDMAAYFADHGWRDILIAFPFNIREIESLIKLAPQCKLTLLVESIDVVELIDHYIQNPVLVRVEINVGANRSGLAWDDPVKILNLVNVIQRSKHLHFDGILTHAGHAYHVSQKDGLLKNYQESLVRMQYVQSYLQSNQIHSVKISVGDTPTTSVVENLGKIDEIRPGNFLFYDVQQYYLGACQLDQIAVSLACPIVALELERNEIVIYGGAIHLSKDHYQANDKTTGYGIVVLPGEFSWDTKKAIGFVRNLTQEHGVIQLDPMWSGSVKVGDIVCILPAHSCLTVQAMRKYLSLNGEFISTLNCES